MKVSKRQPKRAKANPVTQIHPDQEEIDYVMAKDEFISIEDERELEAAGQSILPNVVEQEVHFKMHTHFFLKKYILFLSF